MRQQSSYNLRNCNVVYNIVLIGAYALLAVLAALFLIDLHLGHKQVLGRLVVCGIAFLYIAQVQRVARRKESRTAAYMLIAFFMFFAASAVWIRGVNSPVGLFAFGLSIVLAGILLKTACAFRAALVASLLVVGLQVITTLNWHRPEIYIAGVSNLGNIIGYCTVFGLLATVAWFYNREVDHSSTHAEEADAALQKHRSTLRQQVKKRTSKLEQIQLEEIQQMYRFAELGQLGVTLLHDLANQLTALTLEIEGMQNKRHSKATDRARQIVQYLESTVDSTRDRLNGDTQKQPFNIIGKTSEAMTFLNYKAERSGVIIDWHPPARSWTYEGDPAGYCQLAVIVTSNAIDAYDTSRKKYYPEYSRRVEVRLTRSKTHILLRVSDWGKGILKKEQKYLFKPFHSTKEVGMGIGLFMAKQAVETSFSGTLVLTSLSNPTEFLISLPLKDQPVHQHTTQTPLL